MILGYAAALQQGIVHKCTTVLEANRAQIQTTDKPKKSWDQFLAPDLNSITWAHPSVMSRTKAFVPSSLKLPGSSSLTEEDSAETTNPLASFRAGGGREGLPKHAVFVSTVTWPTKLEI